MHLFTSWGESLKQYDKEFQRQAHPEVGAVAQSEARVVDTKAGADVDVDRPAPI